MSNEVTSEAKAPEATQAVTETAPVEKTLSDPNLSLDEFTRIRRGEKVTAAAEAKPEAAKEADAKADKSALAEKAEQKQEAAASDTEATEGKEETEDETEAEDSKEPEAKEGQPKKKGGFQRRIDKLNAKYTAAQAEIEHWKAMALKGAGEPPKQDAPKVETAKAQTDGRPKADDFATHEEWIDAVAEWKVDQKLKAKEAEVQKARLAESQKTALQSHQERVRAFAEKHEDFEDAMESLVSVPRSPALEELIVTSENGPALLYELAKDPKEAKRIASLPPLSLAREMGRIEARLSKASEEAKQVTQTTKKLTQAPKPITPVSTASSAGITKKPEDMTFPEFVKWRREQSGSRRGA